MIKEYSIQDAPESIQELFHSAKQTREKAYSPYSGHKVGAALRALSGKIFTGCNVENASFGATICAERTALLKAVSEIGTAEFTDLLVITQSDSPWPPCGLCRQMMAEFSPNAKIYCANLQGKVRLFQFEELLPDAFTPNRFRQ